MEYFCATIPQVQKFKKAFKELDKNLIDEDIRTSIIKLNDISGIATLNSCQGHSRPEMLSYPYIQMVMTNYGMTMFNKIIDYLYSECSLRKHSSFNEDIQIKLNRNSYYRCKTVTLRFYSNNPKEHKLFVKILESVLEHF